jgi:hypothetical protein
MLSSTVEKAATSRQSRSWRRSSTRTTPLRAFRTRISRRVGYANASGDIERNILARGAAALGGGLAPLHPGSAENPAANFNPAQPARRAGYAYRGRDDIWLTPDAYLGRPEFARDVALHEFSHTRQPSRPAPISQVEGGADWLAAALAEQFHMPEYQPGYPQYAKRFRKMAPGEALRAALLR